MIEKASCSKQGIFTIKRFILYYAVYGRLGRKTLKEKLQIVLLARRTKNI